jgi:hypothetical protein
MEEQHVYHHNDAIPKINVSVERNSRGRNWTATVMNAPDIETAMELLQKLTGSLERAYGSPQAES